MIWHEIQDQAHAPLGEFLAGMRQARSSAQLLADFRRAYRIFTRKTMWDLRTGKRRYVVDQPRTHRPQWHPTLLKALNPS